MALKSTNPSGTLAWQKLRKHFESMECNSMKEMFANDSHRAENFHVAWEQFLLDYSKNNITEETINLLVALADEMDLQNAIKSYFKGDLINNTEKRAVLHTALRAKITDEVFVTGNNIIPEVYKVKKQMELFSEAIISGSKKGYSNKAFTDIVNIGIGGSDLGPAMSVQALQPFKNHLRTHFVSNIDSDYLKQVLQSLDPETTLFIVVSKSFCTQETIVNATTIKEWFLKKATFKDIEKHFVAVSSNVEKAQEFGISTDMIFPMWDWVGGRFSIWSAVGLSISLSIGYANFEKMLEGANAMDVHFKKAPFHKNIPVLMALLSVWYSNFFQAETEAIIPYSENLKKLVPYLQQSIMESNGKNCMRDGVSVTFNTGTIVWGGTGTNSQHAFFQLLHQGTRLIPVDFIGFKKPISENKTHHDILMANFFAQSEALLTGKSKEEVIKELEKNNVTKEACELLLPFKVFEGNKPSNTILIDKLTPENFGSLIALYEHKLFVQGIIWNINSFDQMGVELGKELATSLLSEINSNTINTHNSSTSFLVKHYISE